MIRANGFTLIELLIALTISTIVAVGTVTLFRASIDAKNTLLEHSEYSSGLARVFRVIEQDVTQLSPSRPVRDAFGEFSGAVHMDIDGLFFTRNGWANSRFLNYERSTLQRVRYWLAQPGSDYCPVLDDEDENLAGGCLLRAYTAQLDDDGSLDWYTQPLLRPVKNLTWQFLVQDFQAEETDYVSEPPDVDSTTGSMENNILAIKMTLETATGQTYEKVMITPTKPVIRDSGDGSS